MILALPLLNLSPLFFPGPWAQSVSFRIIFAILLFLFLKDILLKPSYPQYIKDKVLSIPYFVSVPLAGYLLFVMLSTIFALEPGFSFWGSPYRGDGSLNSILYILFAFFTYIIIKKEDWKKIWAFAIMVGCLVSLIAVAQQFHLLSESVLVPYSDRPPSTLGNTNFLSAYLILLIFFSFSFGFKEKKLFRKALYIFASVLLLLGITLTISRAGFLGIIIGFCWLLFFWGIKNRSINRLKNIIGLTLLFALIGIVVLTNTVGLSDKFDDNYVLKIFATRLTVKGLFDDGRFSSWRMVAPGLFDNSILGTGPENFSVVFDRYFDPSLPKVVPIGGQWWDRAHNFMLEIALTTGIPSLLLYLFFWSVLFLFLQKQKNKNPDEYIIIHSTQAVLISYLVVNFFGFDCPPTYIISFLIAGFSFSFISKNAEQEYVEEDSLAKSISFLNAKKAVLIGFGIFLLFFIWQYNVQPLKANAKINWAKYYLENDDSCKRAYNTISPHLNYGSYINTYVKQTYVNILTKCSAETNDSNEKSKIIEEGIKNAKEILAKRPYYTRAWVYLGVFESFMLEKNPESMALKEEIDSAFERASELSPKRTIILFEWAKAYLVVDECQNSLNLANECISKNPNAGECWWLRGLSNLCLQNEKLAGEEMQKAETIGFKIFEDEPVKQGIKVYVRLINKYGGKTSYYRGLAELYDRLSQAHPDDFQYHASLAYVYRALGEYAKARKEANYVLRLSPESEQSVREFLKTLPY